MRLLCLSTRSFMFVFVEVYRGVDFCVEFYVCGTYRPFDVVHEND